MASLHFHLQHHTSHKVRRGEGKPSFFVERAKKKSNVNHHLILAERASESNRLCSLFPLSVPPPNCHTSRALAHGLLILLSLSNAHTYNDATLTGGGEGGGEDEEGIGLTSFTINHSNQKERERDFKKTFFPFSLAQFSSRGCLFSRFSFPPTPLPLKNRSAFIDFFVERGE